MRQRKFLSKSLDRQTLESYNKIMIMAPHPDDEVLMAGQIIKYFVDNKRQKDVVVVLMTNGDADCEDQTLGKIRIKESIKALRTLGLDESNLVVMGYGDTGGLRPWSDFEDSFLYRLYTSKEACVISSEVSNEAYGINENGEKHDWNFLMTGKHSQYTKNQFALDLHNIIKYYEPNLIIGPSTMDAHGDHYYGTMFIRDCLKELDRDIDFWETLIHAKEGDDKWPVKGLSYNLPESIYEFGIENLKFICYKQYEAKNIDIKKTAILCYKSQIKEETIDYLLNFAKEEEGFIIRN